MRMSRGFMDTVRSQRIRARALKNAGYRRWRHGRVVVVDSCGERYRSCPGAGEKKTVCVLHCHLRSALLCEKLNAKGHDGQLKLAEERPRAMRLQQERAAGRPSLRRRPAGMPEWRQPDRRQSHNLMVHVARPDRFPVRGDVSGALSASEVNDFCCGRLSIAEEQMKIALMRIAVC